MKTAVVPLTLAVYVGLPLALIAWAGLGRVPNRVYWVARTSAIVGLFAFLWQASGWHFVSIYTRYLYGILLLVAVGWSARHLPAAPWWPDRLLWYGSISAILTLVAGLAAYLAVILASGAELPDDADPVDLEFPLRQDTFWIASGGSAPGGNRHLRVKDNPDLRHYRGQAYALDIVALNSIGTHASGLYPSDPEAYAIWNATVYAPCDGTVVRTEDSRPDLNPPESDSDNPPGNFVFLRCGDYDILLAHLRHGSVRVDPGASVERGTPLGTIGNSGNTSEPHLHIHAQRPAADDEPFLSGEPVPITFDGRFLPHATTVDRTD